MFIYLLYIFLFLTLGRCDDLLVKDAGIGFVHDDDIAIIFYVTLENHSETDYEISVCMAQCCDHTKPNDADCNSMSLIGGDMGILSGRNSKNVTLIYPNLYLISRQGQCAVTVHYRNGGRVREKTAKIPFNTVTSSDDGIDCPSVDMDQLQNCRPVDCVVKYSGMKSYFDSRLMECVCASQCASLPEECVPEIGYSIATNNCTDLNYTIGKDDLHVIDSNKSEPTECISGASSNIFCHHGTVDINGQCDCDPGWTTTTDEETYSPTLLVYHMCNIEVGAWNCLNKSRIKTTTILIAVFAITIASKILILMCILNWCYRRYKDKKEKFCSDKLDPNREEIVLCEDLQEFDECLCEEQPQKKSHFLKTQTVNVSYYPCIASTFSSVHCSTISNKFNKRSLSSDESIILSKTTSSSVHVSFDTESDAATEQEGEDVELSGEGEEISDADADGVGEEEMYGEGSKSEGDVFEEMEEQSDYTGMEGEGVSAKGTSSAKTKSQKSTRSSTVTKE